MRTLLDVVLQYFCKYFELETINEVNKDIEM